MLERFEIIEQSETEIKLKEKTTGELHRRYKASCSICNKDRGWQKQFKRFRPCKSCALHIEFLKTLDIHKYPNVDFNDSKVHHKEKGGKETRYRTKCLTCQVDRGYITLAAFNKECRSCTRRRVHASWSPEKKKEIGIKTTQHFFGSEPWNKGKTNVYSDELIEQWQNKHSEICADPAYRIAMSCAKRDIPLSEFKEFSTTENERERSQLSGRKIQGQVFERDNYICNICNVRGGALNAHHMNAWNLFPNERFDLDNLVTLCKNCHNSFHSTHGRGSNTKEQFLLFKKERELVP